MKRTSRKLALASGTRIARYKTLICRKNLRMSDRVAKRGLTNSTIALKLTIARLWGTRDECSGEPLLVGMVHDEIFLEVDENYSEVATDWLMRCMSEAVKEVIGDPETPVVVDIEARKSWGGSA
jgi:hypothetical protein